MPTENALDKIMARLTGLVPGHVMVLLVLAEGKVADQVSISSNTSPCETFVILHTAQTAMLDTVLPLPGDPSDKTKMN